MSTPDWFYKEHQNQSIEDDRPATDQIIAELDHLEGAIHGGWKEQQVQKYLKEKPYLLVGKFRSGHGTFAFPELGFGSKYYADWLISSGHSGGVQWELIELECPQSSPFIKNGHFSQATRKGLNQIQDWRNWIQRNLDMAERPKANDGLGLFDIRPRSVGLVIVGQNSKYKNEDGWLEYNKNRKNEYEQKHIRIESYETFIGGLRFRYQKPPYR